MQSELELLCRSCGLCCDGSLFGRVDLEPDEVSVRTRLRVLPSGKGFEQPCSALESAGSDRCCTVYDERPRACRRFLCRLYDRHRRERGRLEGRLAVVRRVRALLAALPVDPEEATPDYLELARMLTEHFSRA